MAGLGASASIAKIIPSVYNAIYACYLWLLLAADLDISQIVDGGDIKKVGYYLPTAFYINTTLLTWKDGKSPESGTVLLIVVLS